MQQSLQLIVRLGIAAIFLYAATAKALEIGSSAMTVSSVFREWAQSNLTRYLLISGEAVLAIWLLTGRQISLAGVMTLATLSAFSGFIILELCQEYPKPCGCMGSQSALITNPNAIRTSLRLGLVRNLIMMLGAAWLYLSAQGKLRKDEERVSHAERLSESASGAP